MGSQLGAEEGMERGEKRGENKTTTRRSFELTLQHGVVELRNLLSIIRDLSLSSDRDPGSSVLTVGDVDVLETEKRRERR